MNNIKIKNRAAHFILLLVLLLTAGSCTKFDEPALINSPSMPYAQNPEASQIIPADSAMAGVREITIMGKNFYVNNPDSNFVYFQGKKAIIKSVSADRIVINRPVLSDELYGRPLSVTVGVPSALGTSKIQSYKVEQPVRAFGDFSRFTYALMAADVDKDENIYMASRRIIYKIPPDGINIVTWASLGSDFAKITDLKLGPPNSSKKYLYALIDKQAIYRFDLSTAKNVKFAVFPSAVDKGDFDDKGNFYAAKSNGVYVLHPDSTFLGPQGVKSVTINELRVFNSYLYAATAKILYRIPITDDKGKLGTQEAVVDLNKNADLKSCEISSFNFSSDGTIYLCLKGHARYSVFVLETDGSITPFYSANILPRLVEQMIWGCGRYLYLCRGSLVRDSVRFYKMGMDRMCAPYLGR